MYELRSTKLLNNIDLEGHSDVKEQKGFQDISRNSFLPIFLSCFAS